MVKCLPFLFIFVFSISYAEEKVTVHSLDPSVDLSSLDSKKYDKHQGLETKPTPKDMPTPSSRDEFFHQVNLDHEIKTMDQLDRDILYRSALKYSLPELVKHFPGLPKEKLEKLKLTLGNKK
jgi:hypothetical protein